MMPRHAAPAAMSSWSIPLWSAVGGAWLVLIVAVATGRGDLLLDHDAVLEHRAFAWPVALLLFLAAWQLMVAAMMLPSSLPMMQAFRAVSRRREHPRLTYGLFLLGYAAIWTMFALLALLGDSALHWLVDHWQWLAERPGVIGGTVLLLAGAFQFSPLKERCLDACRDPLAFLWRFYRRGPRGAWRIGVRHGLFCLGCCWALMLTMFALGVGSVAWMVGLTGVMVIEKTSRNGRRLVPLVGVALIAWGALVIIDPGWLPRVLRTA
jgi:predicted metal-binding membrane protein